MPKTIIEPVETIANNSLLSLYALARNRFSPVSPSVFTFTASSVAGFPSANKHAQDESKVRITRQNFLMFFCNILNLSFDVLYGKLVKYEFLNKFINENVIVCCAIK